MGASEIREFWKREILTVREFVDLWIKEVPGDDPYGAIAMLADLIASNCRCLPYPWYQDPLFELFKPELGKERREAQAAVLTTLRSIAADRNGIERAENVRLVRDELAKAFEARKVKGPRFLYPPSLAAELRAAKESGALDLSFKAAKAAALGCEHSPDFRSVRWFGVRHTFSQTQARAIEVLWHAWEDGEHGLSQKDIGEAVGSASNKFRLRDLFRLPKDPKGMHAAWKTMIHEDGRGVYILRRPPAGVLGSVVGTKSSR